MRQIAKYDRILKYRVTAELTQPLHVGSAGGNNEEILIHPVTGLPFLQATGIAGVLRSYMDRTGQDADGLFGESGNEDAKECHIAVTDGRFTDPEKIRMEKRPHVKISRETGSVSSAKIKGTAKSAGQKFDMDYIGAGASFSFDLYIKSEGSREEEDNKAVLDMLSALNDHEIQFGGKRSEGCGQVKVSEVLFRQFAMTEETGRAAWAREDALSTSEYKNETASLSTGDNRDYILTLSGKTENDILIKAIAVNEFGEGNADAKNIRNAQKEYIIPGSSIKGAVRDRAEKICAYLKDNGTDCGGLIARTFGEAADGAEEGIAGNAAFSDAVIGSVEEIDKIPLQHRIHVDKFTGGVFYKGLFAENNAAGSIKLVIHVHPGDFQQKSAAVLLLALRDLAAGLYNLGSGYSVGKGFMAPEKLTLKTPDGVAEYSFENPNAGKNSEIFDRCVQSLKAERSAK